MRNKILTVVLAVVAIVAIMTTSVTFTISDKAGMTGQEISPTIERVMIIAFAVALISGFILLLNHRSSSSGVAMSKTRSRSVRT